jgi:hypothetical protein
MKSKVQIRFEKKLATAFLRAEKYNKSPLTDDQKFHLEQAFRVFLFLNSRSNKTWR